MRLLKQWRSRATTKNAILLLLITLCANSFLQAQTVTLSAKNEPLVNVFKQVQQQSGYIFWYKNNTLKNAAPVTLSIKSASLKETLDRLFTDRPLSYEIVDKTIVVKPKGSQAKHNKEATTEPSTLTITGMVMDEENHPLPNVNVMVKATGRGTVTDARGRYQVEAAPGEVLVFSFSGYQPQEIPAYGQTYVVVKLIRDVQSLDETVIIGYGKTTRRFNTSNVSSVKGETIEAQPVTNVLHALSGRVAGLQIIQESGIPGAPVTLRIRGRNSIAANNNPLYIVDGVPFISEALEQLNNYAGTSAYGNPLNTIDPNDVESIEVLKDADATAIYGSRGSNGVILITTKKGKLNGRTEVKLNASHGWSRASNVPQMFNTAEYLKMRRDAFANSNNTPTASTGPDILLWDSTTYTDWQRYYIGENAQRSNIAATISGGTDQISFLISGTYYYESSLQQADAKYKRGGVYTSLNYHSQNRRFSLQTNSFYSLDNSIVYDSRYLLNNVIALSPNFPKYNEDGSDFFNGSRTNPEVLLRNYNTSANTNLNSNIVLSYMLLPNLVLRSNAGYNKIENKQNSFTPISSQDPSTTPTGRSSFNTAYSQSFLFEPQLDYSVKLLSGTLNAMLGSTMQSSIRKGERLNLNGYTNDNLLESTSFGNVSFKGSSNNEYRFVSAFSRLTYNLQGRYIVNGSFRRDGSSRFGPGRQFGNFGSIGAAWILSNTALLKQVGWLSFAKLRGSYGSTGNDGIGDYGFLSLYSSTTNYGTDLTLQPSSIANDNYQWEVNKKLELALELGLFRDRLFINTSFYRNRSDNQLVGYPLASITGFSSYQANLPALVQNKGWEIELNSTNVNRKAFRWTTSANFTLSRNKLLQFPDLESTSYANSYVEGQSLNIVQLYHFEGVDPVTGDAIIQDVNGDGAYTTRSSYNNQGGDYVLAGTTDPKWFGGLENTFSYKGFKLSVFFQHVQQKGYNLYQFYSNFGGLYNSWTVYQDYWKQPGDQTNLPKPYRSSNVSKTRFAGSDATFSDASFTRLKNIQLRYSLPKALLTRLKISAASFYLQGQNILTFTNFIGYDPETNIPTGTSFSVPTLRTWTAGINLSL